MQYTLPPQFRYAVNPKFSGSRVNHRGCYAQEDGDETGETYMELDSPNGKYILYLCDVDFCNGDYQAPGAGGSGAGGSDIDKAGVSLLLPIVAGILF